jgi:menaquinone-dependent protoporphyrinogen IX oxidase
MKGVVIYNSRYGATATYANWIGSELHIPVYDQDDVSSDTLKRYDYFVLGGPVYVGKIKIASWIRRNKKSLGGKTIFLFVVSATPANETGKLNEIVKKNFDTEMFRHVKPYFLRGKMEIRHLSAFDRFVLKMGARLQKDPAERRKMLTDFNEVRKENLTELLTAIKAEILQSTVSNEGR